MCNYLFLASDKPLPLVAGNEIPGLTVTEEADPRQVPNGVFTKPHIYHLGSHLGCSCPYCFEPDWNQPTEDELREWNDNREDFRQLVAYLDAALAISRPLELYNGEDYWLPPLIRRTILLDVVKAQRFVFHEREFLTVS
jgi:hypothetical protein